MLLTTGASDRARAKTEEEWNQLFADYKEKYPEEARTLDRMHEAELPEGWDSVLPTPEDRAMPPNHSGKILNALAGVLPELMVVLPTWLFQQDFAEVFWRLQRDNTKIATSALGS